MANKTIGAYEAKTNFSKMLQQVTLGTDYIITNHGKPVAKIIPFTEQKNSRKEAINRLIESRNLFMGEIPYDKTIIIKELIEDGRKY